jgi:hypothetical protein
LALCVAVAVAGAGVAAPPAMALGLETMIAAKTLALAFSQHITMLKPLLLSRFAAGHVSNDGVSY